MSAERLNTIKQPCNKNNLRYTDPKFISGKIERRPMRCPKSTWQIKLWRYNVITCLTFPLTWRPCPNGEFECFKKSLRNDTWIHSYVIHIDLMSRLGMQFKCTKNAWKNTFIDGEKYFDRINFQLHLFRTLEIYKYIYKWINLIKIDINY